MAALWFPALLAEVRNLSGNLVTLHLTYLQDGKKLEGHTSRKLLSGTRGHDGCAVRLMSFEGPALGVAEGIESAIAAEAIFQLPMWSCLNTALLGNFTPPADVKRLVIAADNDDAGLKAAQKLKGRFPNITEIRIPKRKDFADDLAARPRR